MRPGRVARIRVRPLDCLAVVDICEKIGVPTDATFDMCVSAALHTLIEAIKLNQVIPNRDGFEYSAVMDSRFPQKDARLTPKSWQLSQDFALPRHVPESPVDRIPALPEFAAALTQDSTRDNFPQAPTPIIPPVGTPARVELDRKKVRIKELAFRAGADSMNFGGPDMLEYVELQKWFTDRGLDVLEYIK